MPFRSKIILILLQSISCAFAADWIVTPGMDIQAVINNTNNGDRIFVENGHYTGSLIIDKSIQIIGKDRPIIDGELTSNTIQILADNVVLQNLEIQWSGTRLLEDEAGIKVEADDAVIDNCRIINTLHGIYIKGGQRVQILNNVIHGRADFIEALRGNGIHLWNTKDNRVIGNEISYTRDGIYFSFADLTSVEANHIHNVRYGLHYMYSDDNYFYNNRFEHNVAGAALMYSKRINFEKNIFAHNRGYRAYGVLYQSCDFCTASDNLIIDNTRGIYFDASNYNEVWNNDFSSNDIAVHINASCEENKLFKNNFLSNLTSLTVDAKGFPNYWTDEGVGNYWSDYKGYDLNDDGIGDIPHKLQNVFEFLEDDYPEVRLYLFSPAAQALEIAEKMFPILMQTDKADPFPVMEPIQNDSVPWSNFKLKQILLSGKVKFLGY